MDKPTDYLDQMIAWEQGGLTEDETCELFQYLLESRIIYQLQGSYQRTANALLDAGLI